MRIYCLFAIVANAESSFWNTASSLLMGEQREAVDPGITQSMTSKLAYGKPQSVTGAKQTAIRSSNSAGLGASEPASDGSSSSIDEQLQANLTALTQEVSVWLEYFQSNMSVYDEQTQYFSEMSTSIGSPSNGQMYYAQRDSVPFKKNLVDPLTNMSYNMFSFQLLFADKTPLPEQYQTNLELAKQGYNVAVPKPWNGTEVWQTRENPHTVGANQDMLSKEKSKVNLQQSFGTPPGSSEQNSQGMEQLAQYVMSGGQQSYANQQPQSS